MHLIGVGGIGMSGLARIYLARGWNVRGSDVKKSTLLDALEQAGVDVRIGHAAAHVEGADLVVYSSSIPVGHPEREAASAKRIPLVHRAEALAGICEGKRTIAVTGTHGKTTTTALVGTVLRGAGRDPSIVVGGLVIAFGGNAAVGQGPEIVIEADESDSSFLKFAPQIEVITNIEEEHMDHFRSVERIEAAYRDFVGRLPADGVWFGCGEDERVRRLAERSPRRAALYGFEPRGGGLYATDIRECPDGRRGVAFNVRRGTDLLGPVELKLVGRHNVLNALGALSVALELGVPFAEAAAALGLYEGAGRRFDVRFESRDYLLVDDYAHHPTEIRRTLEAAKGLGRRRIVALFQPHRYTRTRDFLKDFGGAFRGADKLFITEIYAASEAPIAGVSAEKLCFEVLKSGHPDAAFVPRAEAENALREVIRPGDLVITLGAGDVNQVAERLRQALAADDPFAGAGLRGRVARNEPIARHTTLKVGGPAEFWIEPEDAADLAAALAVCRRHGLRVNLIGSGSNVLASDTGVRGAVVHLGSPYFKKVWREGDTLVARAGVPNSLFIQYALEQGFGGCEFLCGIPGSIGGAIAMNAGSHGQSVDALVERVRFYDAQGQLRDLERAAVPFSYRSSGLAGCAVLEGVFRLPRAEAGESLRRLEEYRAYRQNTQDLQHASAGCMFKNPAGAACSSGKLIEDAGLKGRRIGAAQVSPKHANFIVNLGGASSDDVLRLIQEVRETVKRKFNVELETEVKFL